MVILSQGIPFLHSGQEFFRTKNGIGNSYRSPNEINWLNWDRKNVYSDQVHYIKGVIEIRKSHQAFRLSSPQKIRNHVKFLPLPKPLIGYYLKDVEVYGNWADIVVVFNPTEQQASVNLPLTGEWHVLADSVKALASPMYQTIQDSFVIEPISLAILVK
jgi:pullulanase